jgi:hypothetical protein
LIGRVIFFIKLDQLLSQVNTLAFGIIQQGLFISREKFGEWVLSVAPPLFQLINAKNVILQRKMI